MIMTRIEKLFSSSRRDAQEEISFCWSPFPEERFVLNEVEVPFLHDETRRYRADTLNQG